MKNFLKNTFLGMYILGEWFWNMLCLIGVMFCIIWETCKLGDKYGGVGYGNDGSSYIFAGLIIAVWLGTFLYFVYQKPKQ